MRGAPLIVLAAAACSAAVSTPDARPPAAIRSELNPEEQVDHVLSRLAYGARPGDAARVKAMGVDAWIASQLNPERLSDEAAERAIRRYPTLAMSTPELSEAYREVQLARRAQRMDSGSASPPGQSMSPELRDAGRAVQRVVPELGAARVARAVLSERQLYEQMVDFWENHFSVFAGKGQTRLYLLAYDRDIIRPNALGRFRDLLGGVAMSPAMLFYLDNWQSAADSTHRTLARFRAERRTPAGRPRGLNENYARELLELHTLGVDGGYTQQDVVEVARALTGWSIDPRDGAFVFRDVVHDADSKVVLGTRLLAGRGLEDGEDVLNILASHPATARHITRKLVIRFVSDSPPPALVDRCARVFSTSDGDIRRTLGCVVKSPEFFSRAAYRAKVKTPFELVVSALRAANASPDGTPRIAGTLARLGQPVFGRQTPDGWPDRADEWLNSGAMVNRVNFAIALSSSRVPGVEPFIPDPAITATLSAPGFQRR